MSAGGGRTPVDEPEDGAGAEGILLEFERDMSEFRITANPLIWEGCNIATLISRFNTVPLDEDPRRTAGGCGCPAETEPVGTGMIPRRFRAGMKAIGNWTGIAEVVGYVTGGGTIDVLTCGDREGALDAAENVGVAAAAWAGGEVPNVEVYVYG